MAEALSDAEKFLATQPADRQAAMPLKLASRAVRLYRLDLARLREPDQQLAAGAPAVAEVEAMLEDKDLNDLRSGCQQLLVAVRTGGAGAARATGSALTTGAEAAGAPGRPPPPPRP